MAKKSAERVSECVGAGGVVIEWLLKKGQNQLAYQVRERICSLQEDDDARAVAQKALDRIIEAELDRAAAERTADTTPEEET